MTIALSITKFAKADPKKKNTDSMIIVCSSFFQEKPVKRQFLELSHKKVSIVSALTASAETAQKHALTWIFKPLEAM